MSDPIRMTSAGPRRTTPPRPFLSRPHLLRREPRPAREPKRAVWVWDGRPDLGLAAATKSEARALLKPRVGGCLAGVVLRRVRAARPGEAGVLEGDW